MKGLRPEIIGPLVALLSTSSCVSGTMKEGSAAQGEEQVTVSHDLSNPAVLAETELEIRNYAKYPCDEEIRGTLETVHEFITGEPAAKSDVAFVCLDKDAEYEGTPVDVLVQSDGLGDTFALTDPYSFWVQVSNYAMGSEERENFVRYLTVCAQTEGCVGLSLDTDGAPLIFPPQVQQGFEENLGSGFGTTRDSGATREALIEDPETFNILLMGKHDTLVDTIILAHIDEVRKRITLLSVPRDLYYGGRKINSYYGKEGIEGQVTAVEEVLGQKIRDYALVDMDDFVDLIDFIGGVDVQLKKPLKDKTDGAWMDGKCSSLSYEPGPYHFTGDEALCIVRSRHSTSDFSRGERQQLVLEGLREKLFSFGLQDYEVLYGVLAKAHKVLRTDMSVEEMARTYISYRGFEFSSGFVLSNQNVLTGQLIPVPYKSQHILHTCVDETVSETCTDTPVIEALVPRNGDWTLVTKYVDSVLNPPESDVVMADTVN